MKSLLNITVSKSSMPYYFNWRTYFKIVNHEITKNDHVNVAGQTVKIVDAKNNVKIDDIPAVNVLLEKAKGVSYKAMEEEGWTIRPK